MEGFIQRDKNLEEASLEGHYLLKQLIDSCLLEKVEGRELAAVRMHDMIRDMAIKITSESTERRFLVRAGVELEVCPEVEKWEGKDRISLMRNKIRFLPHEPKCSELSTLLLQRNRLLEEIPLSFFRQMKNLRVLDLSSTCVVSLPPSISELGSLQALILRECRYLKSVTYVGGLEQLQLLDLRETKIVELPREIGQLTKLRHLDLSYTSRLAHIPADIILSHLEVLEMWRSSYFITSKESEAFIEKLGCLNHLTYFSAAIPNGLISSRWEFLLRDKLKKFHLRIENRSHLTFGATKVDRYLKFSSRQDFQLWDKLMKFPRRIGDRYPLTSGATKGDRYLEFIGTTIVSQEAVGLVQYAEMLRLYCQKEVRTISAMGACNLNQLKECEVWGCPKMENVVITEEAKGAILPKLEILYLQELRNLRSIWEGNGTPGSFRSIKMIKLYHCPNVMHLFSSNVLQLLCSLEELRISGCHRMVEIVTGEVGNGVIALPKLWRIVLHRLPELNRMWEGVLSLESLRELEVFWCASLRQLAIDIEKTPALEVVRGERKWLDCLEWRNDSNKSHLQNKFEEAKSSLSSLNLFLSSFLYLFIYFVICLFVTSRLLYPT